MLLMNLSMTSTTLKYGKWWSDMNVCRDQQCSGLKRSIISRKQRKRYGRKQSRNGEKRKKVEAQQKAAEKRWMEEEDKKN